MCIEVIVCYITVVFLRHSVYLAVKTISKTMYNIDVKPCITNLVKLRACQLNCMQCRVVGGQACCCHRWWFLSFVSVNRADVQSEWDGDDVGAGLGQREWHCLWPHMYLYCWHWRSRQTRGTHSDCHLNHFSPTLFLIVAKVSLPKCSVPYWSNAPFQFFDTCLLYTSPSPRD